MKNRSKKNFFQRFWEAFWKPEMLVLPGQLAFFLFLSVVPTITLISYACSYLNISNDILQSLLSNLFSKDIADLLTPIITATEITPTFFITLGIGYFIASNGMSSIIVSSNTIYGIKDSGFFKRRLKAIIMEAVIVVLFLFVVVVPLLSDSIVKFIHYFNFDAETTSIVAKVFNLLNGPLSWIIIFFFIKTIYTMAPDRKIPSRSVNGGAIFTSIAWIGITAFYSYYIDHYANYSVFYGSLANIVIFMLWVYLLAYCFVIGMAMNYHEEIEKTGVIEITRAIEESAHSAPTMEEPPKKTSILTKVLQNNEEKTDKQAEETTKIISSVVSTSTPIKQPEQPSVTETVEPKKEPKKRQTKTTTTPKSTTKTESKKSKTKKESIKKEPTKKKSIKKETIKK